MHQINLMLYESSLLAQKATSGIGYFSLLFGLRPGPG
jgi:hypothetical protein